MTEITVAVDLSELDTLAVDLTAAGRKVERLASAIVRRTAYEVAATAQQLAPVDTGATRASIHVSTPDGVGALEAEIGPTTHYAPYLEYGTSRMGPHAFMGPALDRHTPAFVERLAHIADVFAPLPEQ